MNTNKNISILCFDGTSINIQINSEKFIWQLKQLIINQPM